MTEAKQRQVHGAEPKARVALAAVRRGKTANQIAAVLTRTQACWVNVPNPTRLAVRKLIVSAVLKASHRTRANKGIRRALADADQHGPK